MRQKTFVNEKATLYLVATPIGNMSEFTPRAIETLKNVSLIGCEDTRTSKILLNHFDITTPVASYHKFNEKESVENFLKVLRNGEDIALISDAGYPLVSDPGSVLVNRAIEEGYNVTTISGASAFLHALVSSGFSLTRFTFVGFLESKSSGRKKELTLLKDKTETLIFYESPHRIEDTLNDMLAVLGNRKIVVARELTKKFEEFIRGHIKDVIDECKELKGEIVIVVEGAEIIDQDVSEEVIKKEIDLLIKQGESTKDIVKIICDKYSLKKNYVYDFVFKK